jgi:hypothetical protein
VTTADSVIDEVLGRSFEIDCAEIALRGRDSDEYRFSGPGAISGRSAGPLSVHLHNRQSQVPGTFLEIVNAAHRGEMPMCFEAEDYHGFKWVGGWLNPIILGTAPARCFIVGKFSQLSTDVPITVFDTHKKATVVFYPGDLRLPMMEETEIHTLRGGAVEQESSEYDHTQLDFDGAEVVIRYDRENDRTIFSTTHADQWLPPLCEVALDDAIRFTCGTAARPRVAVRYLKNKAIVFIRETVDSLPPGLPRPIAYQGPRDQHFWDLFLLFLRSCKAEQSYDSTRLSQLHSQLVFASAGTVHVLILSLVVSIEDLVEQITGKGSCPVGLDDLKNHLRNWSGDTDLKESAVRVVTSMLSRTSTKRHLDKLVQEGVVTVDQVNLWAKLRPQLAHGKIVDYGEDIWAIRGELITMFYRLALRLIGYRGEMSDHTKNPPIVFNSNWQQPR